jgi:hypothetical protein
MRRFLRDSVAYWLTVAGGELLLILAAGAVAAGWQPIPWPVGLVLLSVLALAAALPELVHRSWPVPQDRGQGGAG